MQVLRWRFERHRDPAPSAILPRRSNNARALHTARLLPSLDGMRAPILLIAIGVGYGLYSRVAHAEQNIVRDPDRHPHYAFELEPHALLAPLSGPLPGAGVRGTIVLAPDGFIASINDSVGLGFGADWTRDRTWVPVVMQWNFWLSEHWSVFGEPGIAWRFDTKANSSRADFMLYGGARLRLAPRITLTARVGYPGFTLGPSFLL